ncbi:hypothetical protein SAMN05216421_1130 [Halopseudomonas xinjiangensis]|uniref:Uncharacterized protein n=1 Tax=Halopseudomonas xinjiangensis TaxID=487184 RepID=A0A1H1QG88_9GAMM|nr:hypothetical protein [Halopseudomonas xinjiangensis]SDS22445.1 hypothetical protein SAMN05216421_1130 [Halopseudomonas xinjiangensis]
MHFQITRMRLLGKPLDKKQLRDAERITADVRIEHQSNIGDGVKMGRASVIATLKGEWPLQTSPWPDLVDVQLHSMGPLGMTLTGTEFVDGVGYAQSWICLQR